jgi:predicted nucleic acid-binding protein
LIAFDTNILVYAQQEHDPNNRHKRAAELINSAILSSAVIPVQVLGEFLNVCMRKFKLAPIDAIGQVEDYIGVFSCPQTTADDLIQATQLSSQHQLQYFDALIIAVSASAGATILLSEDMQDGLEIDGLRVINPFLAANDGVLADYFGSAL